jgi:hypothetical protein
MHRPAFVMRIVFRLVVLILAGVASANADCPSRLLGVAIDNDVAGRKFYATEKAEALADSDDSRELAIAEARVAARALLVNIKDVPKSDNGRLRAVREASICSVGTFVFVTVMVDEVDVRRIISLENAMLKSVQTSPTPVSIPAGEAPKPNPGAYGRLHEVQPP